MLISRLREEARALADQAARRGWQIKRSHRGPPETVLAFYGDTFTATALVQRHLFELVEPEFDILARVPRAWTKREIRFGTLGALLALGSKAGFYKPADPAAKWFDARVYAASELTALTTARTADLACLYAEPVVWGAELRAVIHRGRILSLRCYRVGGRRSLSALEPIPLDLSVLYEAGRFCQQVLDAGVALPPAFVMDVGQLHGRGWAVVEFNPIWCSRFYGGVGPDYLDALTDIIRPYGALEAGLARWAIRSRYVETPAEVLSNC